MADSTQIIDLVNSQENQTESTLCVSGKKRVKPEENLVLSSPPPPQKKHTNHSNAIQSKPPQTYIQLKRSDTAKYRFKLLVEQDYKCVICQDDLRQNKSSACLDHQHRIRRSDPIGLNGAGLVRGVLCRGCNRLDGIVIRGAQRCKKSQNLPTILRSLANYLEKPNYPWIHPTEAPRPEPVSKRQYNKLKKIMKQKGLGSPMAYPKTKRKKNTVGLAKQFKQHDVNPYN